MPTYYENCIATFTNQVSREEFIRAWTIGQSVSGRLKNRGVKTILLAIVGALCLAYIPQYAATYGTAWIPAIAAVAAVGGIFYYQIWLVSWAERRAAVCYDSNRLLAGPDEVCLYRDSYTIQNQYERIQGHWTDNAACVDTPDLFVVTGGWDRSLLIIPKRLLTDEQVRRVAEHLEQTFVKKYVRKK